MTSDDTRRFLNKFLVGDQCWEWTATRNSTGYASFHLNGTMQAAHRVSYELFVGPIPAGHEVDHLCFNKGCVNPTHLEPVTPKENTRRAFARITHCPQGHPYDEENTLVYRDHRYCRACKRMRDRLRDRRRRT